jgi:hypothetical protein
MREFHEDRIDPVKCLDALIETIDDMRATLRHAVAEEAVETRNCLRLDILAAEERAAELGGRLLDEWVGV